MNEQMIIELRVEASKAMAQLDKARAKFNQLTKPVAASYRKVAIEQQNVYDAQQKLNRSLKGAPFQGWAMSLMFAGMALQRISQSIYKFGTKAFQEISHSVEGTVTQTDMLEGSMKYLGFTIGQALEPVVSFLIPIIDAISQWTEENPKLVAFGIVLMGIVGTLAMVGGSARLAWTNGLQPFVAMFAKGGAFSAVSSSLSGVVTALGGIGVALGVLAAIVIVLIALWKTNLGGFRDFIKDTFGVLWETIKAIFERIWKIIKTVMDIVVAIFEGDWDKVFALTWKLVKQIVALFLDALLGIGALIVNIMIFAWNLVVDVVFKIFVNLVAYIRNLFTDVLIWLAQKLRNVLPEDSLLAGVLDKAISKLEDAKAKTDAWKESMNAVGAGIKGDYISGASIKEGFANVDSLLGLTEPSKNSGGSSTSTTIINNNISIDKISTTETWDTVLGQSNRFTSNPYGA